ncbi:MAG: serine/threonine protein kinase, partial [Planctomycetaceae bacterium]|nr:serine/threonine protein kinase [Planctomycetaceae bacterium]
AKHETLTLDAPRRPEGFIPGKLAQRYHTRRLIGRGGFGEVYLAYDDELDRNVAIKVPRGSRFADSEAIDAFITEARVAAKLRHPGIATIHDVGRVPNVGCFIVMEYVEGCSLATRLIDSPLEPDVAADIALQIAIAARYAHTLGVIHRDLKPANIMVDDDGRLRILDFGLGMLDGAPDADRDIAGTPKYMAPEQTVRDYPNLDERVDIWAIGVILYQALTGHLPFQGNTEEAMEATRTQTPVPPTQLNPHVPAELERITLRCLEKSPRNRYATAEQLAGDLTDWIRQFEGSRRGHPPIVAQQAEDNASNSRRLTWQWKNVVAGASILALALAAGMSLRRHDPVDSQMEAAQVRRPMPNAWNDQLQVEPAVFVDPGPEPDFILSYKPALSSIYINSTGNTLLHTGSVQASEFQLTVGITKNGSKGISGLWFGMDPSLGTDAEEFKCQTVYVHIAPVGSIRVQRAVLTFTRRSRDGSYYLSHSLNLASEEIEDPGRREATLTVVAKGNHLDEVRWNGVLLDALAPHPGDPVLADPESNLAIHRLTPGRGKFGLYNAFGNAMFANHKLMPLE